MEDKLTPKWRCAQEWLRVHVEHDGSLTSHERMMLRAVRDAIDSLASKPMSDEELAERMTGMLWGGGEHTEIVREAARRLRERAKAPQYTEAQLERMADAMRRQCGYDNPRPWEELDDFGRKTWLTKLGRVLAAAQGNNT